MKKSDGQYAQLQKKYSHLKKEILIGVSIVIILLVAGGIAVMNIFGEGIESIFGDEEATGGKFAGKEEFVKEEFAKGGIVCNPPYIYYGAECCLDQNDNQVCDSDERRELGVSQPTAGAGLPATTLPPETEAIIVEGRLVCNSPYIRHGTGCCLDRNGNAVCDGDETGGVTTPAGETSSSTSGTESETAVPAGTTTGTTSAETSPDGTPPEETSEVSSTEVSEETSSGETSSGGTTSEAETPPAAELPATETSCTDGVDNDRDGFLDTIDNDCRGRVCDFKAGKIWVWSYLPGQDQTIAPLANGAGQRRIGCCTSTQCRTIDGQCINYDTYYTDEYICGDDNNWDRCSPTAKIEVESDGGNYICSGSPPRWNMIPSHEEPLYCADDRDNDRDGYTDEFDIDCVGRLCEVTSFGTKAWVWSKIPPYDEADPPSRIACCNPNQCVNSAGECINYDASYVTSGGNREFICGDDNNWDRCGPLFNPLYNKHHAEPTWEYGISDGGNYECMGNSHPDVWVRR